MSRLVLSYVQAFTDRHGKVRHYFRRPGFKRVALPGLPGSAEFMAAYQTALAGETAPKRQVGAERTKAGTINALAVAYYRSPDFMDLADSTRANRRGIVERLRARHGHRLIADLEQRHVRAILEEKAATPQAANNLRKVLRVLMRFAIEREWRKDDPTAGIRKRKIKGDGYHTWSEAEIAAFEAKWPVDSRARLAFALLLYTGQRRSDVITMGRQHLKAGKIHVCQQKTKARLAIKVHPDLDKVLAHAPKDRMAFLTTQSGAPFTCPGFGNWFRDVVTAAGLPAACRAHGLRKAAARRLAEAGCTAHQIAAVTGHRSIAEVAHYTAAADQERMADEAIDSLSEAVS